jgi:hypothetical protein
MIEDEYSALMRHVYKFCWHVALESGISADPFCQDKVLVTDYVYTDSVLNVHCSFNLFFYIVFTAVTIYSVQQHLVKDFTCGQNLLQQHNVKNPASTNARRMQFRNLEHIQSTVSIWDKFTVYRRLRVYSV